MIRVWTDAAEAGLLDRLQDRGSAFAYLPETVPQRAVSVTMLCAAPILGRALRPASDL